LAAPLAVGCTQRCAAVKVIAVGRSEVPDAAGSMHGFPAALTSFVGRAAVVDEISGQLGQYRLVTVSGPGGAGKTRLAGEVARQVAGRFADGVWLAELAAVRDPAQVAAAVAAALGIRDLPLVAAADAVAHALARRQLLLVLDNCEHVIGAAAELCGRLLLGADDVRVLATSREPLRIAGEARYRLGPLTLPDPGSPADPDGSEAVALFADRARRADASFALDGETAPVVARLVARLDGMPLAIELAAARVEALGVAQLLDRIGDRFTLLEAGDRLAAARQRSLAAAVEWSYRLLDELQRRVFRAVSVFPGPFTLEGAEAVAGAGSGPAVLHLVDCSLLVPPRAGPDGRSRYVMLETLRACGAGLLAGAGGGDAVAAALAGYALRVAEDAMGLTADTGEVAAARWLDAEDATMRQVLDWAMEHDAAVASRLAAALAWWWQVRGRLAGQVPLLRQAAGRAAAGSGAWCLGHTWLGQASLDSADPAGALRHFTVVCDAAGDRGPFPLLARCLSGRSATLLAMGRIGEAAGDARRSVAVAREGDDPLAEALAVAVLGLVACVAGDRVGAVQLARQAEQLTAGRHGPAVRVCGHIMTSVLIEAGELAAAERVCAAALAGARDAGDLWSLGNLLEKMVVLDLNSARFADAAGHLREGLQTALRTGSRARVLDDLDCCGYLCALTGRRAEAVTLWAAVVVLQGHRGFAAPSHPDLPEGWFQRQEPLRDARRALGPAQARAAEERGTVMSLATAAEYALMLTAAGPQPPTAAPGPEGLSPRERELVTLVARGHTDAQIAGQLYISVRTVSSHLDRIRDKTGCRRRADLTRLALSAGLV
jgi:predicted ATPase/DNA-binding CsgD family transcriptional regulator